MCILAELKKKEKSVIFGDLLWFFCDLLWVKWRDDQSKIYCSRNALEFFPVCVHVYLFFFSQITIIWRVTISNIWLISCSEYRLYRNHLQKRTSQFYSLIQSTIKGHQFNSQALYLFISCFILFLWLSAGSILQKL